MYVSVVVCTRNRSEFVVDCVRALSRNRYANLEILVVDQSTSDQTKIAVNQIVSGDTRIRYVSSNTVGASIARNVGIDLSKGDVIAFTDDDCVPADDWVESLAREFARDPGIHGVFGKCLPHDEVLRGERPVAVKLDTRRRVFHGRCNPWSPGHGNNMAFRREVFDAVGFFDKALGPGRPHPSSEDADLTYRVLKAGFSVSYCPEVVISHRQFRHGEDLWKLEKDYGIGAGAMYAKHLKCGDLYAVVLILHRMFRVGMPHIVYGVLKAKPLHVKLGWYRILYSALGMWNARNMDVDTVHGVFADTVMEHAQHV